MQCNRIPHQLESMLVPVTGFSFKEVSCSIGAVDFEPLVLGHEVAVQGPAKVVQDRSYGMGFEITALELGVLCRDDGAEEPGSHAVIVSEVIEMITAKSKGFGYQASILRRRVRMKVSMGLTPGRLTGTWTPAKIRVGSVAIV